MQQGTQSSHVPGYPVIHRRPSSASIFKTILFVSSLLISLSGTILAILVIPFSVSEEKLHYDKHCFGKKLGDDDNYWDDDDDVYQKPVKHCHEEYEEVVHIDYALIPLILQLVVFGALGCLSCCCNLQKYMFGVYFSIMAPTIGITLVLGTIIESSAKDNVMTVVIGCLLLIIGNSLLLITLGFGNTPLLIPAFVWRERGISHPPQMQQIRQSQQRPQHVRDQAVMMPDEEEQLLPTSRNVRRPLQDRIVG